ncbi:hypothetical protein QO004_006003 [Rhizobium mesoamericanum]|nr:hypothetical protein [Rhizobium mesoamericanum]
MSFALLCTSMASELMLARELGFRQPRVGERDRQAVVCPEIGFHWVNCGRSHGSGAFAFRIYVVRQRASITDVRPSTSPLLSVIVGNFMTAFLRSGECSNLPPHSQYALDCEIVINMPLGIRHEHLWTLAAEDGPGRNAGDERTENVPRCLKPLMKPFEF